MKRLAALLLLALALAAPGCRSARTERDYLSLNRTSREFLRETKEQSRRMARFNLRTGREFRSGGDEYRNEQRHRGREFAVHSTKFGNRDNTRRMWAAVKREFEFDREEFRRSNRFGFLDSGE